MAVNAFLTFFDKADGESIQRGFERWIELDGWDWEVEAATTWVMADSASVGKPHAGALSWRHVYDSSSPVIMGHICAGSAFPRAEVRMCKTIGTGRPAPYFVMTMEGVYITKVTTGGTEEGNVSQRVEMVFKTVTIDYHAQDPKTGKLRPATTFNWDIPAGTASPSA